MVVEGPGQDECDGREEARRGGVDARVAPRRGGAEQATDGDGEVAAAAEEGVEYHVGAAVAGAVGEEGGEEDGDEGEEVGGRGEGLGCEGAVVHPGGS